MRGAGAGAGVDAGVAAGGAGAGAGVGVAAGRPVCREAAPGVGVGSPTGVELVGAVGGAVDVVDGYGLPWTVIYSSWKV